MDPMRLLSAIAAFVFLLVGCGPRPETEFEALVVGVKDGDTIEVLPNGGGRAPITVRLWGIDAPEKKQPFGTVSKKCLADKVFGEKVRLEGKGKDVYKRLLARVFLGDRAINEEQVQDGMAWWFEEYAKNEARLQSAQENARRERVGLWVDPHAIAPWEFRQDRRERKSKAGEND